MRRFVLHAAVGCAAFLVGVVAGSMHQTLVQKRVLANVAQSTPPPAVITPRIVTDQNYPDDEGLSPRDIEYFIDRHPQANLKRLWERLGMQNKSLDPDVNCSNCKAQSFYYNLDDDLHEEVLLRIDDPLRESYMYLIFKHRANGDTQFLGYIHARSKYRPSRHVVLLSGGKAWLIVERQTANGSGLAAYRHTIYQVTPRGVKPAVSYFSEIFQSGSAPFPARQIIAFPVSCEAQAGSVKVTVSYAIEYSIYGADDRKSLFTKQQTAVLIGAIGSGTTRLEPGGSNITQHEFETVFNFDSMGEEEFVNYNRSELRAIAAGRDLTKKEWLKNYLDAYGDSGSKRELLPLLR